MAEPTAPTAPAETPTTTDTGPGRIKAPKDEVLKLKAEGVKPTDIAAKFGVAIGTIYKILRENGEGSGRTLSGGSVTRKGLIELNVSDELGATITRLQAAVDATEADKAAEVERHTAALAAIEANGKQAEIALAPLKELHDKLSPPAAVNGDTADAK